MILGSAVTGSKMVEIDSVTGLQSFQSNKWAVY